MKKIITMLAAVTAVVAVNAAAVDWNYKITGEAGGASDEFAGYTAYLLDASYYTGLSQVTKDAVVGKALGAATLAQTSSSGRTTKTYIFSTGAQQYTKDVVEGEAYSYYLVLVDKSGDNYFAKSFDYTARGDTATPSLDAITLASSRTEVTSGMKAWSTGTDTPGGIPEPTSGLLLVLGGAALALRRKQK